MRYATSQGLMTEIYWTVRSFRGLPQGFRWEKSLGSYTDCRNLDAVSIIDYNENQNYVLRMFMIMDEKVAKTGHTTIITTTNIKSSLHVSSQYKSRVPEKNKYSRCF